MNRKMTRGAALLDDVLAHLELRQGPISQRTRRQVLGQGTHGRMWASSPLPLTRTGMWMP